MHPSTSRRQDARVSDISLGGALLASTLDSNVGARVQVAILIPSGDASYLVVIDAYIVRKAELAFAIEWSEFAPTEVIDLIRAGQSQIERNAMVQAIAA
jgi:hypothetical protein